MALRLANAASRASQIFESFQTRFTVLAAWWTDPKIGLRQWQHPQMGQRWRKPSPGPLWCGKTGARCSVPWPRNGPHRQNPRQTAGLIDHTQHISPKHSVPTATGGPSARVRSAVVRSPLFIPTHHGGTLATGRAQKAARAIHGGKNVLGPNMSRLESARPQALRKTRVASTPCCVQTHGSLLCFWGKDADTPTTCQAGACFGRAHLQQHARLAVLKPHRQGATCKCTDQWTDAGRQGQLHGYCAAGCRDQHRESLHV